MVFFFEKILDERFKGSSAKVRDWAKRWISLNMGEYLKTDF
jgi:hypothetical protein